MALRGQRLHVAVARPKTGQACRPTCAGLSGRGGLVYLAVQDLEQHHIERACGSLCARGLPAVRGELVEGDAAGCHYFPGRDQAVDWLVRHGLVIVEEGSRRGRPAGGSGLCCRRRETRSRSKVAER